MAIVLAFVAAAAAQLPHVAAQEAATYAERLGWPKGARVVIFHVDDAGMSRDSNQGVIEATPRAWRRRPAS